MQYHCLPVYLGYYITVNFLEFREFNNMEIGIKLL